MALTFTPVQGRSPQIEIEGSLGAFADLVAELEAWVLAREHEVYDIYTDRARPIRIWDGAAPTLVYWWIEVNTRSAALDVHDVEDAAGEKKLRELIFDMEPAARTARLVEEAGGSTITCHAKLHGRPDGEVSEVYAVALALEARRSASEAAAEFLADLGAARDEIGPITFSETEQDLTRAAARISHCGDYGHLWWNEEKRAVVWVGGDADDPERGYTDIDEIEAILGSVDGVDSVEVYDEHGPADGTDDPDPEWIRLPTVSPVG